MGYTYTPKQTYKVFVRTITYNQAPYIKDNLDGVAMQQTNFPFVHFVIDDASTDGEQDVILSWMNGNCDMENAEYIDHTLTKIIIAKNIRNTNCTHVIYLLKQNLYKRNEEKLKMYQPWREHCEYEALCEGDDYWIDPLKLQKQVDWMEKNPDCSICYTKGKVFLQNKNIFIDKLCDKIPTDSNLLCLLENGNYILTASVMYRYNATVQDRIKILGKLDFGDYITSIFYAEIGYIHRIDDNTCVYRYGVGTWMASGELKMNLAHIVAFSKILPLFKNPDVRMVIENNIERNRINVTNMQAAKMKELRDTTNSIRYKIGKFLLQPLTIFRSFSCKHS